jgi:hypothetical protein
MIKLDDNLLAELGLAVLPKEEKTAFLRHMYETLEMRVGTRLAERMTDQQMAEFEQFINTSDEQGAFKWLESNFPNYKEVVAEEFEKLKSEVQPMVPQILAAAKEDLAAQGQGQPQQDPAVAGISTPPAYAEAGISGAMQSGQSHPSAPMPVYPEPANGMSSSVPQQYIPEPYQAQPPQPFYASAPAAPVPQAQGPQPMPTWQDQPGQLAQPGPAPAQPFPQSQPLQSQPPQQQPGFGTAPGPNPYQQQPPQQSQSF